MSFSSLRVIGLSSDGRTNVWRFTPSCGHPPFSPPTSMFSRQILTCQHCLKEYNVDYNSLKISEVPA